MPSPEGLTAQGQHGLAILALCMVWWLMTPVALPVTSLLGMALLPLMGVLTPNEAFAFFGNQSLVSAYRFLCCGSAPPAGVFVEKLVNCWANLVT